MTGRLANKPKTDVVCRLDSVDLPQDLRVGDVLLP